jgi:hypothetical protein
MSPHHMNEGGPPEAEALLRQMLTEHAPDDIDSINGWEAIMSRLPSTARASHSGRALHLAWRRSPLTWVAAAVVAVLLMGAGFAGGHYLFGWGLGASPEFQLIGDKHLYADINRSQTDDGITITVAQAYADEGSILIAYTIRLAPEVHGSHPGPVLASYDLADQFGEDAGGGATFCGPVSSNGRFVECLMDTTAYHPPAFTSQLDLTWTIAKVYVFHDSSTHELDGNWTISFSVPYHHTSNGPDLAPAQPTKSS